MKRITIVFCFTLLPVLTLGGVLLPSGFELAKKQMPYAKIAKAHPIDDASQGCPRAGADDKNTYHSAQNAAKNDFTETETAVPVTVDDFSRLQEATDSAIASKTVQLEGKYPKNRTQLTKQIVKNGKSLGEGSVVTIEAYVFGAHYSNTKYNHYSNGNGSGEANNCNNDEPEWNDIHVALASIPAGDFGECGTVTAEVSPHYRPVTWSRFHDGLNGEIEDILPGLLKHQVVDQKKAGEQPLRVKITGPLFYDASHQPCRFKNGKVVKRNSPARRSIWEIHPIYRIQVYNLEKDKWQELDDWAH